MFGIAIALVVLMVFVVIFDVYRVGSDSMEPTLSKDDYIEVEGEVIKALPNAIFRVLLDAPLDKEIDCYISGKIRKNFINIIPGDRVQVSIPIIDPTKGRITFRTRR